MTYQKSPKQQSNYPGMLESFEKKRQMIWIKTKFKPNRDRFSKTRFTPFVRKNP